MADFDALAKKHGGTPNYDALATKYGAQSEQPAQSGGVVDTVMDVGKGALKGFASTVFQGGDLIRRGLGMERVINNPDVKEITTPTNTAQRVGFGVEQAAEYLVPAGAIGATGKALATGSKAVNLGTRATLEGAAAGAVAGVQTGGDTTAMRNAALTAGGLTAGAGAVAAGARPIAGALKESAKTQYSRVLNATTKGNKYRSEQIVPELIERGVMAPTMKGLKNTASSNVERYGRAIGDAVESLPDDAAVPLEAITSRLQQSADEAVTATNSAGAKIPMGPHAKKALRNVEDLKSTLTEFAVRNAQTGVMEVPAVQVRQLRQYFDKIAAKAGRHDGKTLADESMAEAHGMAADAIRQEFAQAFPDIAKLNKEFNFWKKVEQVTGDTLLRREGQAKPLTRRLAQVMGAGAGSTQGPIGAMIGAAAADRLQALLLSPAWGTVSAVTKDRLAKALAEGNKGAANFYIAKAAQAVSSNAAATRSAESRTPAESPVQ
jgi:hypothetical protein